jgi:hypothetical protein
VGAAAAAAVVAVVTAEAAPQAAVLSTHVTASILVTWLCAVLTRTTPYFIPNGDPSGLSDHNTRLADLRVD